MRTRLLVTIVAVAAVVPASPSRLSAQDRVDPIPTGPAAVVEALSPFRGNPDSSKVARILAETASESGFPGSDDDRVLAARLWRRAGETELALAALDAVDRDGDARGLATYEAARVVLESGNDRHSGAALYWRACAAADASTLAQIGWDILAVANPDERDAWKTLGPGEAACDWLREFWDERAQGMAISRDERLALHHERLAHAREWYWIPRPRFRVGPADFHGRPAGLGMDDRGLIFVRMGSPLTSEGF
ncbi:MAG: hypothetical protein ACR2GQ_07880, partial [Gemmatimonadota bacterium]